MDFYAIAWLCAVGFLGLALIRLAVSVDHHADEIRDNTTASRELADTTRQLADAIGHTTHDGRTSRGRNW